MDAQLLWFASRAAGAVALVMFTAVMVLGMLTAGRGAAVRLPAAIKVGLHRNLSLLLVAFLAVHVVTAIADGFVDISAWATLVPFASAYETWAVSLGTLGVDVILALIVTGIVRARLSHRAWQAIHLTSYAMFPLVIVHAIALAGVDTVWLLPLSVLCGAVFFIALLWRGRLAWRDHRERLRRAARFRAPHAARLQLKPSSPPTALPTPATTPAPTRTPAPIS